MYVCRQLADKPNIYGEYACKHWDTYTPSLTDALALPNLSFNDVSQIWVAVTLLFAVAYIFKQLPFFIRRR